MTPPSDPAPGSGPVPPRAPERWFAPGLALITVLGLLGRFVYLVSSRVDHSSTFKQGDAFWYSTTAANLANGKFFINAFSGRPTADHPPLTVLVLGPASVLFHNSTYAQRLTMILIGSVTVAVIGLAARRLAGPTAGLAAAAVAALSPALWVNDVLVMSETPTALLVALVLWAGIALADRPSGRLAIVAGVLCGLAALARAETGLFLPFMVWPILALARQLPRRPRLRWAVFATLGTLAALAPWTVLNLTRFQEPVAISTNDGLTVLGANCGTTYHGTLIGGWVITPCVTRLYATIDTEKPPLTAAQRARMAADPEGTTCVDRFQKRLPCWDSSKVSQLMRDRGLGYTRHHLSDLPRVVLARNGRVWGFYRFDQGVGTGVYEGRTIGAGRWGFYLTWLLLPTSAAGLVLLRRRRVSLVPFVAAVAIVVVVSSAFYGLVRFRLPFDVAACLLAGVVVAALVDRVRTGAAASPAETAARSA